MNPIALLPRRLQPDWFCIVNHDTDENRYFESATDAFEYMVIEDIGPDSPKFTIHECDPEHVDPAHAEACTFRGAVQVKDWRRAFDVGVTSIAMIAVVLLLSFGAYSLFSA